MGQQLENVGRSDPRLRGFGRGQPPTRGDPPAQEQLNVSFTLIICIPTDSISYSYRWATKKVGAPPRVTRRTRDSAARE